MALQVRANKGAKLSKLIGMPLLVLALTLQPMYGLVAGQVANAADGGRIHNGATKVVGADYSDDESVNAATLTLNFILDEHGNIVGDSKTALDKQKPGAGSAPQTAYAEVFIERPTNEVSSYKKTVTYSTSDKVSKFEGGMHTEYGNVGTYTYIPVAKSFDGAWKAYDNRSTYIDVEWFNGEEKVGETEGYTVNTVNNSKSPQDLSKDRFTTGPTMPNSVDVAFEDGQVDMNLSFTLDGNGYVAGDDKTSLDKNRKGNHAYAEIHAMAPTNTEDAITHHEWRNMLPGTELRNGEGMRMYMSVAQHDGNGWKPRSGSPAPYYVYWYNGDPAVVGDDGIVSVEKFTVNRIDNSAVDPQYDETAPEITHAALDKVNSGNVTSSELNDGKLKLTLQADEDLQAWKSQAFLMRTRAQGGTITLPRVNFEKEGDNYVAYLNLDHTKLENTVTNNLQVRMQVYDLAGNASGWRYYSVNNGVVESGSDIYRFTVDNVAPDIAWQVQSEARYNQGDSFHVRPRTGEVGTVKSVYIDTVTTESLCYSKDSDHKNMDVKSTQCQELWDSLAEGEHKFIAVFTDRAGNTTESVSSTFIVDDNVKPGKTTIVSPTESQEFDVSIRTIRAEWNSVEGAMDYQIRYSYVKDGESVTATKSTPNTYRNQSLTGDVSSSFTVDVRARDAAGNWGDWSDAVTYHYGLEASADEVTEEDEDTPAPEAALDEGVYTLSGVSAPDEVTDSVAAMFAPQPVFTLPATIVTGDDDVDQSVLGAQTEREDTTPVLSSTAAVPTADGWKIFGLMWYWWVLLLGAIAAAWWIIAAARGRNQEV